MLAARVATALVLVTAFLAGLFWLPHEGWRIVVAVVGGLAAWEWAGLASASGLLRAIYGGATAAICWALAGLLPVATAPALAGSAWLAGVYAVAVVFWLFTVPIWLKQGWRLSAKWSAAAAGWLVLLPPALALVHLRGVAPLLLLAAMALVWVADIAAYFVGRALGRRKLAPSISPGKTWEGAIGGVAFVLGYGFLVAASGRVEPLVGVPAMVFAPVLLVLAAISIEGDLFESLLKRQAGLKDSSHLLPGHGGILDRIDSLTSTLPMVGLAILFLRH